VHFIHDVGVAYRASARKAPLMDEVGFHPYPNPNKTDDPPAKGYQWPNAGLTQLPRLQQAFWDAFHGTGQATFAESGVGLKANQPGVKWALDETAYQVSTAGLAGYTGAEGNQLVTEATQAKYYGQIVNMYECDARVASLLFFKWVDEPRLAGYQSGFQNILGTLRPAAGAVRDAVAKGCAGKPASWKHTNGVVTASASFHPGTQGSAFTATAGEHVSYTAGVYRVGGGAVAKASGSSKAYWTLAVKLPRKGLGHGTFVYRITLRAKMNPARQSTFTSRPFSR
jgi:hypothetical protein